MNTFVVKKVKLVNNFCQNNVHLNIYLAKNVIRNWWFDLSNCQYFVNANFVRQTKTPRLLTVLLECCQQENRWQNYRNLKLYRGRIVISKPDKNKLRQKRHTRVRGKISGTSETPRLNVFRSNTNIYAQVIDDVTGTTLASASSLKLTGTKTEQAAEVGKLVAEAAKAKGVEEVVFDRGGYLYHGRVAALATAAREAGLKF